MKAKPIQRYDRLDDYQLMWLGGLATEIYARLGNKEARKNAASFKDGIAIRFKSDIPFRNAFWASLTRQEKLYVVNRTRGVE